MHAARDRILISLRASDLHDLQLALFGNLDTSEDKVLQRAQDLHARLERAADAVRMRLEADKIERELCGK